MSQFTAKGCLPQRQRHKDEVQRICRGRLGEMRVFDLDKKKKGRKRCETGKQDVGANMSVNSEGRQKCLNCIFGR